MEELLQGTVIQLLGIVIGGILAIASAYMTLFVAKATQKAKVETEKLNDERQRKMINSTLNKVDELLKTNIIALENTVKKDMLELIADGKIEKDELKKLAQDVKENVLNQLGNDSLAILNDSLALTSANFSSILASKYPLTSPKESFKIANESLPN